MYLVDIFGRHTREVGRVFAGATETHRTLRDRVVAVVVATVAVDLVCAALALWFEHDAKGSQITSYGSALFWTTTQLLTVSSSVANPISSAGRILDVFMEIWAMVVISSITASFGSFLVHLHVDRKQRSLG